MLFGDPKQSPGGVADNLREHRALLLKAPIGLLAAHRWFMPHDLPAVICSLLHSSAEVPLDMLAKDAEEASHGRFGRQWHTDEHCPSPSPVGAALQAAKRQATNVVLYLRAQKSLTYLTRCVCRVHCTKSPNTHSHRKLKPTLQCSKTFLTQAKSEVSWCVFLALFCTCP